jgi:hypothetical protein
MKILFTSFIISLLFISYVKAQESECSLSSLKTTDNAEPQDPCDVKTQEPVAYTPTLNEDKIFELQLRSSIFSNQGIGYTNSAGSTNQNTGFTVSTDPVFYNDVYLQASSPKLGASTRIVGGIGGSFVRFFDGTGYNILNANAGLLQEIGENMTGELGWRHNSTYGLDGLSNLSQNSPRFALRRLDFLTDNTFLSTDYELQANFADSITINNTKVNRSRLSNFFRIGLGYNFTSNIQGFLSYRLANDNYNVFECNHAFNSDCSYTRHEFSSSLSYYFTPKIYANTSVSYIHGDNFNLLVSSQTLSNGIQRDLNYVAFGLTLGANIPLF